MHKNHLSLELGGKPRNLRFNMGALLHLGEISGKEPLTYSVNTSEYKSMLQSVKEILYAGLVSQCETNKENVDFTFDDVCAWVSDFDMDQCVKVINAFAEAYKVASAQEGGKEQETFHVPATN